MKAMILAAGRGERMRPLTDRMPKPLVPVLGKPLICHAIERIAGAGVTDLIINLGYRGNQIREAIGTGQSLGVSVQYSEEGDPPLETGGGVFNALPLLGDAPFLLINSDVFSDIDFQRLRNDAMRLPENDIGLLVLVDRPEHRAEGDFRLDENRIVNEGDDLKTFSGVSILRPGLFDGCKAGRFPIAPLLRRAADQRRLGGRVHSGLWSDVGTPDRLARLEEQLREAT